jgi:hypothetical protein
VSGWNKGKQSEWKDRKMFALPVVEHPDILPERDA